MNRTSLSRSHARSRTRTPRRTAPHRQQRVPVVWQVLRRSGPPLVLWLASFAVTTSDAWADDFQTRCQRPGVLRCVGFDQASDIAGTAWGSNTGIDSGASTPTVDSSVKASGNSSLKFTIPSNSAANTSGSYWANFSADLSTQFGENSDFYVQWRQRFSPEFLNTIYTGSAGWKQVIIGTGDKPGCTTSNTTNCSSSCTTLEVVAVNAYQRGYAQMYNSCTGSA